MQQFSSRVFWNWTRCSVSANLHCMAHFDGAMPVSTSKESWSSSVLSAPMWKDNEEWQFRTTRCNRGPTYLLVSAHLVISAVWSPVRVLESQVLPGNHSSWNCAELWLLMWWWMAKLGKKVKSASGAAEQPSQMECFTQSDALQGVFST